MIAKKLIKIGIIIIIAATVIAAALINGITIDINGAICFNTKFYSTPGEALASDDVDLSGEIKDIAVVRLDDHNAVFVASCGDGDILAAQMKTGGKGYHFMGNYVVYRTGDPERSEVYSEDKLDLLGAGLISSIKYGDSKIYCGVFSSESVPDGLNVNTVALPYEGVVFVCLLK